MVSSNCAGDDGMIEWQLKYLSNERNESKIQDVYDHSDCTS